MGTLEHRHLRSALEFAVLIAAEGHKRRPPLAFPKDLKPYFGASRLPNSALGRLRRAIEADDRFRAAIATAAVPELVDDIGRCWLTQRDGWESEAAALVAAQSDAIESQDVVRDLKRSEKRRLAAEQVAARTRVDLARQSALTDEQRTEIDFLNADLIKAQEAVEEMRAELVDARNEVRHARDREAAAVARVEALQQAESAESAAVDVPEPTLPAPPPDRVEVRHALDAAIALVASLEKIAADPETADDDHRVQRRAARRPIAVPHGMISTSAEAAEHLVREDAAILVDGYNVAKLGWPNESLELQRAALISGAENLARRCNADITLVFDGASVVGAHADSRRAIRIVYSPAGITADDAIRAEVNALPPERNVIVVTNDREIVNDVRAAGANVIPSNAFLAVL